MALRPTLFIGLGTTGLRIIKHLRQFLFDTYERYDLPIFRYIAIDTSEEEIPNIPPGDDLKILYTPIRDTQTIRATDLNPQDRQRYNRYLEEWVPKKILEIPGNQYTNGAKHIRAAGRLCLWHNWNDVAETITRG